MPPSEHWIRQINNACAEPDAKRSNELITTLHYELSEALANKLGREGGPNFHTWAVWGSKKAGATIRQEDLGDAIRNATTTAGIVGIVVGVLIGIFIGKSLHWPLMGLNSFIGGAVGLIAGISAGREIALWSRRKAAMLVLQGNQAVIQDIGTQTARFLDLLEDPTNHRQRGLFFAGVRPGPTEQHGQDRLTTAFRLYLDSLDAVGLEPKREKMIAANCEIVYHEHIRLDPFIRSAMPFIVRRCATQRLMTYEVGDKTLAVGENVPGLRETTAAGNWTNIEERMRYVFALFRVFHQIPEVFSTPHALKRG
jgi:hypothetical protein